MICCEVMIKSNVLSGLNPPVIYTWSLCTGSWTLLPWQKNMCISSNHLIVIKISAEVKILTGGDRANSTDIGENVICCKTFVLSIFCHFVILYISFYHCFSGKTLLKREDFFVVIVCLFIENKQRGVEWTTECKGGRKRQNLDCHFF